MSSFNRTERQSTDSISEEILKKFELKMPELKLPRVEEPNPETATKRSRSKPKKELVGKDEKKSKTRERRSRSTSKTRSSSRKRSEIKGAKLYTKKDLQQLQQQPTAEIVSVDLPTVADTVVQPAKRSLRSSSSTSTSKSITKNELDSIKSLDDSLVREREALLNEIDAISVIGQSLDNSFEQQPRYSLRKRGSPTLSDKQSKAINEPIELQERLISSSSPPVAQLEQSVSSDSNLPAVEQRKCPIPFFNCGYLKFSRKQIIKIVIISLWMILALAFINYLNENSLDSLVNTLIETKDKIVHFITDFAVNLKSQIGL